MTLTTLAWTVAKIAVILGFVINVAGLLTWYDRRGGAMMQDRIGPNRASLKLFGFELRIGGLLHTLADGVKFFTKEDFLPPKADKLLFGLAPMLAMIPVLVLLAVIPFGDTISTDLLWRNICVKTGGGGPAILPANGVCAAGYTMTLVFPAAQRFGISMASQPVQLVVSSLDVGLLFVFAMAGQGIVGAAIAGWASDNKFSLMGAVRAASQMVSYEVTMGLTLVGCMMLYGTVRLDEMSRWQGDNAWGIFVQPVAFVLFFTAAIAEIKRIPFDLPEAESELVSGYFTEYSGMKFGMFYFAEYMEIVSSSMLLVAIFLGGWQLPFLHRDGLHVAFGETELFASKMPHIWVIIFGVVAFFGKTLFMCWIQAFVRWSLPRFRYDQLMRLGWTVLLPASLANILATGIGWLCLQRGGDGTAAALKVAGDVTQGVVALAITGGLVYVVVGLIRSRLPREEIIGSSATLASAAGGTRQAPIRG
jgi:NADH-quinone oxidoreductase subunit H